MKFRNRFKHNKSRPGKTLGLHHSDRITGYALQRGIHVMPNPDGTADIAAQSAKLYTKLTPRQQRRVRTKARKNGENIAGVLIAAGQA